MGEQLCEDPYMRSFFREIHHLRSILNSLKCEELPPPEEAATADWEKITDRQQNVLNTLYGDFAMKMTDLEQRVKQNTIRILGVREQGTAENTLEVVRDYFRKELDLRIIPGDIEICYRAGKMITNHVYRKLSRPIVVKFVSDDVRKVVWKRKVALQREDICEELCPERYKIKQEAILKFGKQNVSIVEGNVQVTIPGNWGEEEQPQTFSTMVQFRNFLKADKAATENAIYL